MKKNLEVFLDFLKSNNLSLFGITDFQKYNISNEIPIVPIRNITILPTEYEDKLIQIQGDYKYTSNDMVCFDYYDESDNMHKDFFAYYNSDAAKQILAIKKQTFNNKYALFGKVQGSRFVIEYLEHID